ncbi:MAG: hypothetical protein AAF310_03370 [Myxococcota bacterium]
MTSTLQLLLVAVAAIVTLVAAFASPLLGTPTAEMATLLSVVWGPVWLLSSAVMGARRNRRGFAEDLVVQTGWIAVVAALCIVVALINRLRFHSCSPTAGMWVLAVLTLPVWCLNTVVGLWLGRIVGNVWRAVLSSLLLLGLYGLWQLLQWRDWPSFCVVTHLSALVVGDLAQGYYIKPAVIAYRCSTLLFAFGLGTLGIWLFQPTRSSSFITTQRPPITALCLSVCLCCFGWIVHSKSVPDLIVTKQKALQTYSVAWRLGPVLLHTDPHHTSLQQAESVLHEAHLWLQLLAQRFGLVSQKPIHIWLHPNQQAQAQYTGAHHVDFAVGQQVHITSGSFPHRTLGHELTHILVGQQANTIWQIPGRWKLVPNIGLHEGLAVAATPELMIQEQLTLWQQAAAMVQIGRAPPLQQLFAAGAWGFLQHTSSRSYTMTGAALWFLLQQIEQQQGLSAVHATVQRLIRFGSLKHAFDSMQDYTDFQQRWLNALRQTELPPYALQWAQQRFSGHSILQATCDPRPQQLLDQLMQHAYKQQWNSVANAIAQIGSPQQSTHSHNALADSIEAIDQLWLQLAQIAKQQNNMPQALHCLYKTLDSLAPAQTTQQAKLLEQIADTHWQLHHQQEAVAIYSAVDEKLLLPHEQRRLQVKQTLAAACSTQPCPHTVRAALQLLTHAGDLSWATHAVAIASALAQDGYRYDTAANQPAIALSHYLLARYLLSNNAVQQSLWHLHQAAYVLDQLPDIVQWELLALLAQAYTQLFATHMAMQLYEYLHEHAPRRAQRLLAALQLQRLRERDDLDCQSPLLGGNNMHAASCFATKRGGIPTAASAKMRSWQKQ